MDKKKDLGSLADVDRSQQSCRTIGFQGKSKENQKHQIRCVCTYQKTTWYIRSCVKALLFQQQRGSSTMSFFSYIYTYIYIFFFIFLSIFYSFDFRGLPSGGFGEQDVSSSLLSDPLWGQGVIRVVATTIQPCHDVYNLTC